MFNLANQITLARIFFVIPIVILLYFEGRVACFMAALLFSIASITDFLDGHIARKSNMVTSFGKFLDPLADKLLICSVLIMFVELGWVPAWMTILIVGRELAVTGLRAMAIDEGVLIAADKFGKVKTVLQIVAIIPLLVHYPLLGLNMERIGIFLLYIALALTIFSGLNYFYGFHTNWLAKNRNVA
ncbi:MAG: CDP-diacylglycerol--glycerol-3-phosphate 3-phosphatidyltransferase [Bilophila sp.]